MFKLEFNRMSDEELAAYVISLSTKLTKNYTAFRREYSNEELRANLDGYRMLVEAAEEKQFEFVSYISWARDSEVYPRRGVVAGERREVTERRAEWLTKIKCLTPSINQYKKLRKWMPMHEGE